MRLPTSTPEGRQSRVLQNHQAVAYWCLMPTWLCQLLPFSDSHRNAWNRYTRHDGIVDKGNACMDASAVWESRPELIDALHLLSAANGTNHDDR